MRTVFCFLFYFWTLITRHSYLLAFTNFQLYTVIYVWICKEYMQTGAFLVSENWVVLICKNFNSIYPRILETGLFFWRKRFLNFVNVFSLFCFSIWTNINSHFTKFGWNWPSGFWEEDETVKRLQSDVTDGLTVSRRSEKVN